MTMTLGKRITFRLDDEEWNWLRDKAYKLSTNKKKVRVSELIRGTIKDAILTERMKQSLKKKNKDLRQINIEELEEIIK